MSVNAIHAVLPESQAGKLVFPEVVQRLLDAGVESYFVDAVKGEDTVYLRDGSVHVEKMSLPHTTHAASFSSEGVVSAIRAAQADQVRYPEFMKRATAAGVVAYWAFLTGQRVIYFGRQGEFHIEHFPGASQP